MSLSLSVSLTLSLTRSLSGQARDLKVSNEQALQVLQTAAAPTGRGLAGATTAALLAQRYTGPFSLSFSPPPPPPPSSLTFSVVSLSRFICRPVQRVSTGSRALDSILGGGVTLGEVIDLRLCLSACLSACLPACLSQKNSKTESRKRTR